MTKDNDQYQGEGPVHDPTKDPLVNPSFSHHLRSQSSNFELSKFTQSTKYESAPISHVNSIHSNRSDDNLPPITTTRRKNVKNTFKSWLPEICWCLVSIGCLIAIIVTLRSIDRKPQPKLAMDVPISAVIAFLATFCRMALTIPVVEGVSQLKWNWFAEGKARPLGHMETFDLAGRGPWGSIKLLWVSKGRSFEIMVFIVMITGFLTSSITQAAITTTRLPNESPSTKPMVQSSARVLDWGGGLSGVQQANQYGYSTPYSQKIPTLDAICGSGYCDFDTFHTMGVCVAIQNITDQLNVTQTSSGSELYNISLPNGATVDSNTKQIDLAVISGDTILNYNLLDSLAFKNESIMMATRFINMFFVWKIPDPNNFEPKPGRPERLKKFVAYEVLMYFCVKTVDVNVRFSRTQTNITDAQYAIEAINATMQATCTNETVPDDDVTILTTPSNDRFGVPAWALNTYIGGLGAMYQGKTISGVGNQQYGVFVETIWKGFEDAHQNQTDMSIPAQEERDVGVITGIVHNIAAMLTNVLRKGPIEIAPFNDCKDIVGTEFNENMIKVRWEWLTLLVIQVVVSVGFLIMVMIQTQQLQVDVLKSQLLPVLLAVDPTGFSAALQSEGDKDVVGVQKQAPRTTASLENQGTGWTLRKRMSAWSGN